ncbi:MAG: hypothetical protein VX733_06320 [Candidatus Latescibacterota bacterium]|nr:hypothetical protein [Candidatus Latescibacterota bacterium]
MSQTVDGNFKRLEDEVNRLLEVLEQLRSENASLREQVAILEADKLEQDQQPQQDAEGLHQRIAQLEDDAQHDVEGRARLRHRIEQILVRLDQAGLSA